MIENIHNAWPEILTALGQTFYMLVLTIHHIVCDAWSIAAAKSSSVQNQPA